MAIAEIRAELASAKVYLDHFGSLQQDRRNFEDLWQRTMDYIMPRRTMSVINPRNVLRPRRITSLIGPNCNDRLAAFILTFLIDATRPFLLPNVKQGLVAAGRPTVLDDGSLDYLGDLQSEVHDRLLMPKANLMLALSAALKEYTACGNMVLWTGRRRGFGPVYQARPFEACWWSEDEEGVIDTLYFKMMVPVHRVLTRWPDAKRCDGWDTPKAANEQDTTPIILAVEPRKGGVKGAVRENKPFAYIVIAEDKGKIIETSGYDTFPYAVARYDCRPGQTYSYGIGTKALPEIAALNHFAEIAEDATDLRGAPPILVPARLFGGTLDRRPNGVTAYNPAGLGLQRADQAVVKLDIAGDPDSADKRIEYLTQNIEMAFFTDWMRQRDSGDQTATETNDRIDIRLRGMSSIVSTLHPFMGQIGDRSMEVMKEEGLISPPPASLSRVNVDWEYAGPLQIAQLRGQVQASLQLINAAGLVREQDPTAAQAVDLSETLRSIADGLGTSPRQMNSREHVDAARAAAAKAQAQQQTVDKIGALAKAANDGGSGMAAMAGAAQQQQQLGAPEPGAGAGFAPAAPFAQPVPQAA